MTPTEAAALFALLRAAYPDSRTKVGADTADLWLMRLRQLEHGLGVAAVQGLIDSSRFWPSLAELAEQVTGLRQRAAEERVSRERWEAQQAFQALKLPPLREIPEAVALLERFEIALPSLPRVEDGPCGDCGKVGERCRIGRVDVCAGCARARLRVGVRLNDEAA